MPTCRFATTLAVLTTLLPACATTSAVLWATDHPPEDGAILHETALSQPVTRYSIEPQSIAPLRIACTQTTKWGKVHTKEAYHTWGTGWRVIGGLLAAAEGGMAFAFLNDGLRHDRQAPTVVGSLMAADAVATVLLISLKNGKWRTREMDGPKELNSPRCPDNVTVEFADKLLPVYEAGQLAPADEGWFTDAILGVDGKAVLHRPDGTSADLQLTRQQRCELARQLGRPAAAWVCEPPPPALPPTGLPGGP